MKKFTTVLLYILAMMMLLSCGTTPQDTQNSADTTDVPIVDTSTPETNPPDNTPEESSQVEGNGNRVVAIVMGRERLPGISGKYNTWQNSGKDLPHVPDKVDENGLRDIASVFYPSIGLYDVTDPDYQEYMMQLCKMSYIDTLNYYFYSDDDVKTGTWYSDSFDKTILPMLRKYGLSATARLEDPDKLLGEDGDTTKLKTTLSAILKKLDNTVLKIEDRPVFSQFTVSGITADVIDGWKEEYLSEYGATPFFMLRDATTYLSDKWNNTADGYCGWTDAVNVVKPTVKYKENVGDYLKYVSLEDAISNHDAYVSRAKELLENQTILYYAEGINPGFDDLAVWGWGEGPKKIERGENGELYIHKWQSTVDNNFPMVNITTWDDWGEATTIEPTLEYGTDYLEITRKYAAEYKDIVANIASLELPGWIYKIRKTTKDTAILAKMTEASGLIAEGKFDEAEALVKPIAESLGIPMTSKEFFNYPTTPTTPLVVKEEVPTPTKGANGEEIFAPTADTYIKKSTSKSVDSGDDDVIKVKSADSTKLTRYGFIKFNTEKTEVTEVEKATLRLYCTHSSTDANEIAGRDINLYAAGTDWTEQSFSWALRPEISEKLADLESGSFKSNTWIEIDVTDYVKAHIGETFAFAILNEGADTNNNHLEFSSKEADSNAPELVIE